MVNAAPRSAILAGMILLAAALWVGAGAWWPESRAQGSDAADAPVRTRPSRPAATTGREPEESKVLSSLKRRWLAVEHDANGSPLGEVGPLLAESLRTLLCGNEMVDLIEFLSDRGHHMASSRLRERLTELLKAGDPELRASLMANGDLKEPYRSNWSYCAGIGCPAEEFKALLAALGDDVPAIYARFGRCVALATTVPAAAVGEVVNLMEGWGPPVTGYIPGREELRSYESFLEDLVAVIPAGANFAEITAKLPADVGAGPVSKARFLLMERWALEDMESAVTFALDHSQKPGRDSMTFAGKAMAASPPRALDYARGLPAGERFDAVADFVSGVLFNLDYRKSGPAVELAHQIGDPVLRTAAVERITNASIVGQDGVMPPKGN